MTMAKHITVSKAEHEYMIETIAQDGMIIARLEAELAQAKEDIKRMLIVSQTRQTCEFCKMIRCPAGCEECELDAEWRGYQKGE